MLRLIPVVEIWAEHTCVWAPLEAPREWVELHGNISNPDIARVVAMLAGYNGVAASEAVEDVARALERRIP